MISTRWTRLGISSKLVLISVVGVLVSVLTTSIVVVMFERIALRDELVAELATELDVLAYNIEASLTFREPESGQALLHALGVVPDVEKVTVFDRADRLFTSFESSDVVDESNEARMSFVVDGQLQWPNHLSARLRPSVDYVFLDDALYVKRNISGNTGRLGSIVLQSGLGSLYERTQTVLAVVVATAMLAILVGLLIVLRMQKLVSTPIIALSRAINRVKDRRDYSVRAAKLADDELGVLTDGFNDMLVEIERRDRQLSRQRDNLELIVESRTRDWRRANRELESIIVKLKLAQEARARSEENTRVAEAATKEKSRFLANMSHELRTPMNGVLGMLSLLTETRLNEEQREYVSIAYESGVLLLELLNDVLDFSKIEEGKLVLENRPFNVREVIEDVLSMLGQVALSKGVDLCALAVDQASMIADKEWVSGDVVRFKQVLTNIVSNAVKFTHEGHIQIRYDVVTTDDPLSELIIEVVDTGIGIPQDAQTIVFENFSQADSSTTREYGGTGLGLALCRQIIELMGGSIGLESEHGKGSTFWVRVPFKRPTSMPSRSPVVEGDRLAVVIDGKLGSAQQLTSYLERCGTEVHQVHTVVGCQRIASELADQRVNFLFVDAQSIDSLDAVGSLQAITSLANSKVVITGAPSDRRIVTNHAFLVKPYRLEQVIELHRGQAERIHRVSDAKAIYSGSRVLVVEDNVINQQVARARLEKLGCDVTVAANGVEALRSLEQRAFSLVLMDCNMPEMDGYECTQLIRGHRSAAIRAVPVVAMTANVMLEDRLKCREFKMSDFLGKPVTTEQLREVLDRWIGREHTDTVLVGLTQELQSKALQKNSANSESGVPADTTEPTEKEESIEHR